MCCSCWALRLSMLLLSSLFLLPLKTTADPVVIKFATLAPEGTPWMNLMEEMRDEVERQSSGQVTFRFYAGGIAGDERDVIRKMRINQLHGGAFSGFGLGEIVSELRVLELPQLFRHAEEAEHVAGELFERFARAFARRGYILLTLNEAGAVHLFSQQPLRTQDDMDRVKMWVWQGDPLAIAMFKAYGITPVPLTLPDVMPSLQSGLINACYGPPLAVLALQWFSRVKYYSASPITHVMGALLVTERQWRNLSPPQQILVRKTVAKYNARAVITVRRQHRKALVLLRSLGLESVMMSAQEITRLKQHSLQVREKFVGKLYTRELLDQVLDLRDRYRQTHP